MIINIIALCSINERYIRSKIRLCALIVDILYIFHSNRVFVILSIDAFSTVCINFSLYKIVPEASASTSMPGKRSNRVYSIKYTWPCAFFFPLRIAFVILIKFVFFFYSLKWLHALRVFNLTCTKESITWRFIFVSFWMFIFGFEKLKFEQ